MTENKKIIYNFNDFLKWLETKDKGSEYWFRGQRNENWDLTPTLYREAKWKNIKIGDGIELVDLAVPNMESEYRNFSDSYKKEFQINAELNELQKLFFLQHEGVKTPLLDWTTNPLTALFFALDNYREIEERPCLYCLNPNLLNKEHHIGGYTTDNQVSYIEEPLNIDYLSDLSNFTYKHIISRDSIFNELPFALYSTREYSHRISRQSGKFTVHGPFLNTDIKYYKWNNYRIIDKREEKIKIVEKIYIDHSAVENLKHHLELFNITRDNIYGIR
ncbi:FRG domain-containing protein [Macrococcus psychrotolerans]